MAAVNSAPWTATDSSSVQAERADIQVRGADHCDVVVDAEVFGVQDRRRSVQVDFAPRPQQLLVVGALGVEDHELIADLGDEQLNVQAAGAGGDEEPSE